MNKAGTSFSKGCYQKITDALGVLGFKRQSKRAGIYVSQIAPDTFRWLGLNIASQTEAKLELYPIVGVVHLQVNKLESELVGSHGNEMSPTLSKPLSYLMPEHDYRTWVWKDATGDLDVTNDILSCFKQYGLPFIKTYSSLEYLCAFLFEMSKKHQVVPFTINDQLVLPAVMYVLNKRGLIRPYLERKLAEVVASGGDPYFETFAKNLLRLSELH